jgi:hypothetical protein
VVVPKELKNLVDARNHNLWSQVNQRFDIKVVKQWRSDYKIVWDNKSVTIFVQGWNSNPASFTHELLHIWLMDNNVCIDGGLINAFRSNKILREVFSNQLAEHVGNVVCHEKMFREFTRLGYEPQDFTIDFFKPTLNNRRISKLAWNWSKSVLDRSAINDYVGWYFATVFSPNKSVDYSLQLKQLEELEPSLFKILGSFASSWIDFDIRTCSEPSIGYQLFLHEFMEGLVGWIKGKVHK